MILNDICHLIVDCPHTTAPDEGVGIPLIRTPNIGKGRFIFENVHRVSEEVYQQRIERAVPQDNDIIFAREAIPGNAAIIKNGTKICLGQRTVLIRPDINKVDPDYLVYYILAPEQQYKLLGTANGATVAHVNLPIIRKMNVDNLPSLKVQQKIGKILSGYDDLIENNQKQIKLLEEAAQRLYKEWFIDLRFPGHENTPIHNGLPGGWSKYSFSEKVSIMSGGTPKTENKNFYGGNIPFFTPKDHDGTFFAYKTTTTITKDGLASCNSPLYPQNTIIITARGTVGKTVLLAVPMAMNQSCYALKCDELNSPYYLFFSLNAEVQKLKTMSNGGVFDTIIVKTFDNIQIIFSSDGIIDRFEKTVTPIMEQIKIKQKENILLKDALDRLLPQLMSGELKL